MWAQSTDTGRVKYVERYTDPLTGKTKYVTLTADKDTKTARKYAQLRLQEKIHERCGAAGSADDYTMQEILDAYIKDQKRHLKISTTERNERILNALVRKIGPDIYVTKLTAAHVRKCLPENPAGYNEKLRRFKAMIRWAYQNDMIDDIRFIDKLRSSEDYRKVRIENKYLEKSELKAVIRAMDKPNTQHWMLLTQFLALTGLRIGEAFALTKADVDLEDLTITINKTYGVSLSHPELMNSPKTQTSNRTISIQQELLPVIKAIQTFMLKQTESFGCTSFLFFYGPDGSYLSYDAYRKYLKETTLKVTGRQLTPHALRHTMTSLFAEAGVPLDVISRRLGHADSDITKEVYMHVTAGLKKHDAEAIRNIRII